MKKMFTIITTIIMTVVFMTVCVFADSYVCGDVNNDGCVDVSDAVILERYIRGDVPFLPWNKTMTEPAVWEYDAVCGDVNNDGEVTIADSVVIKKYIARIVEELPVGPETVEVETDYEEEEVLIIEPIEE